MTGHVGTSTYLSPEQESNKSYNEKVDIYALGLILCELLSRFSTYHERMTTLNDLKYKGKLPEEMRANYGIECDIIMMMTNKDPNGRPSAEELLRHQLFQQWEKLANPSNFISPREPQMPLQSIVTTPGTNATVK